jgi:hypothetical protein
LLYSAKAPASAATSATAHFCPVVIARVMPAFEAGAVCVEVDSVGLTVEEMAGRFVVDSLPDPCVTLSLDDLDLCVGELVANRRMRIAYGTPFAQA